jgi:tripartite-type tricarboxylate transporter receptor subunit TctC
VPFWSGKLSEVVKAEAWMANLKRNFWDFDFGDSAASKRFLDTQYEEMRSTYAAVHLVK